MSQVECSCSQACISGLSAAIHPEPTSVPAHLPQAQHQPPLTAWRRDANWWLPRWLDRRLPHLAIEPPEPASTSPAPVPAIRKPCGRPGAVVRLPLVPGLLSRTDPVPDPADVLACLAVSSAGAGYPGTTQ